MSKVFLVTFMVPVRIPVVADSADDAFDYLSAHEDEVSDAVDQVVRAHFEDDSFSGLLDAEEVTVDSIEEEHADVAHHVPWGDDSDETIADRIQWDPDESVPPEPSAMVNETWNSIEDDEDDFVYPMEY